MAEARRGDQKVEVADGQPLLAKPPALQSETITNRFVEWEEGYAGQESGENLATQGRIARVVDALTRSMPLK